MRVFLYKDYDRFGAGRVHIFDRHIGCALCRNENAFGFPADESGFKVLEKQKVANKDQLKIWAKGVGLSVTGKTVDVLKAELIDIANGR